MSASCKEGDGYDDEAPTIKYSMSLVPSLSLEKDEVKFFANLIRVVDDRKLMGIKSPLWLGVENTDDFDLHKVKRCIKSWHDPIVIVYPKNLPKGWRPGPNAHPLHPIVGLSTISCPVVYPKSTEPSVVMPRPRRKKEPYKTLVGWSLKTVLVYLMKKIKSWLTG